MEKVVYVLLAPGGLDGPRLRDRLLGPVAADLHAAGARRVQVNVVDDAVRPPFGIPPDPAATGLVATVSGWVDAVGTQGLDSVLPADLGPWAGYLVTEAEALADRAGRSAAPGRAPGFTQLTLLRRPDRLSWDEWRHRWQGEHTPVAIATQGTFRYVQNVVVRRLGPDTPPYAAVVEESFPADAMGDLSVFFDAVGDDDLLARHMADLSASCDRFMDGPVPVAWTSEYPVPDPS
jgi:hypothetical protein